MCETRVQKRGYLHRRVQIQLASFLIVSLIMIGIVGYDLATSLISISLVLIGVAVGVVVGFILGRMFALKWHEETGKVIMQMDRTSILIIALYVAFRIYGKEVLGQYIHGETLGAFTFSMLAGIMIGRFLSMSHEISKILKEQKK